MNLASIKARYARMHRLKRFVTAASRLLAHDGMELGGYMAYTALISLFPFTIFLFALAGFFDQTETAEQAMEQMFAVMPREVAQTLAPLLREILASEQPALLTFGIIGTIWATSSGIDALRLGLNRAYGVSETRAWWKRKLVNIAVVLIGAVGMLLASALVVLLPPILEWLEDTTSLPFGLLAGVNIVRYLLAGGIVMGLMGALYHYLPNTQAKWKKIWPGAALCTGLWIVLASLFSLYLLNVGDYSVTYGSLGGIIITLLFLHFSSVLYLLGAEFNAAGSAAKPQHAENAPKNAG